LQIENAFSICNSIARIVQDHLLQGLAIDADYRVLVSNTLFGFRDVAVIALEPERCPWPDPNAITRDQDQILQSVPDLNTRLIPYHHPILNHSIGLNHAHLPDAECQHVLRPKGPNKVQE
jgi:hypothetical protein